MKKVDIVLLVDDDFTSNFLTKMVLEQMGIAEHIYMAEHGQEALDWVEKNCLHRKTDASANCPEVILLDINMPVMNGFEFLEALSSREEIDMNHTKIFILSSSSNPKDRERARKYPIAGYLQKPITSDIIESLVLD